MYSCNASGCKFQTTSASRWGYHKDHCEHSTASIANFVSKRKIELEEFREFKRARLENQRRHEDLVEPVSNIVLEVLGLDDSDTDDLVNSHLDDSDADKLLRSPGASGTAQGKRTAKRRHASTEPEDSEQEHRGRDDRSDRASKRRRMDEDDNDDDDDDDEGPGSDEAAQQSDGTEDRSDLEDEESMLGNVEHDEDYHLDDVYEVEGFSRL
ncbi:hypothetical protein L226DRAFT_524845 [Lentinus tigrinus ALCF2SS1-7]|uniref:Uncharacterized protein n=1 Tax=Lentinus tigrinus ALCF2SS1-6 TaxID=1328759 RepID=A0A5C2S3G9_9APHY|nr:hypothetical protein L227DRAFT_564977 [Lentinus tigrinus ALCF2SS1-6]RPD72272.1 hypothetical protein L226DRAFT_524845 [Lentinus tigrinus ALCF2SS1-7]